MQNRNLLVALALISILNSAVACAAESEERMISVAKEQPLPELRLPYRNPYYATVVTYLKAQKYDLLNHRDIDLNAQGFRKPLRVRAVIQPDRAPLVVVLLGVFGRSDTYPGTMLSSWLADAGIHVLVFNSTFLPQFTESAGHGVTGNVQRETELLSCAIQAFLQQHVPENKVASVGIAGFSYGGVQALMLGAMSKRNALPFKVAGVQAYSPPIRFERTARRLDDWYRHDRPGYTQARLLELFEGHDPVPSDAQIPFPDSAMRALIADVLHTDLTHTIVQNDRQYDLNLLPRGNEFDDRYVRYDHANEWGFERFIYEMAWPYWRTHGEFRSFDHFVQPTRLAQLLEMQPAYSEAIICIDDPLNETADVDELKNLKQKPNIQWLPRGGHLGFINEPWTRAKLLRIFPPDRGETHEAKQSTRTPR